MNTSAYMNVQSAFDVLMLYGIWRMNSKLQWQRLTFTPWFEDTAKLIKANGKGVDA